MLSVARPEGRRPCHSPPRASLVYRTAGSDTNPRVPLASSLESQMSVCRHAVIILILFLGTIGVYAQVRHYRYIDYDDDRHVRENQYV